MKSYKHLLILLFSLIGLSTFAQTSKKTLNYQAVILDPKAIDIPGASITGQPLNKGNVCLRFSLLNAQGGLDYEETQQVVTDEYGLVNVAIGAGAQAQAGNSTSIYKSFDSVLWNSSVKSLKVSVSYDGCNSFKQVSSQALNYTPYALYAEAVDYKNVREAPTKLSQFSNDAGYLIPKDLDPLKSDIQTNSSKIEVANKSIADNKQASDAAFLVVNQSISSLDTQVAANTTAIKENTSSISNINTKITDQQNQISDNRNQIAATNNNLNTQIGGLQGQLNTTNSTVNSLSGVAEVVSNKSTAINLGGANPSDQAYPSQKAAKAYIDNAIYDAVGSGVPDATTLAAGKVKLSGDLGGTAMSPTVPALAAKENTANKSVNVLADGTNDTKYPSVKAVKDYVDQATLGTALAADLANKANILSPTFTGVPTAPTPASSDNSTKIATTAFVQAATAGIALQASVDAKANINSPTFTGTPVLPTGTTGVTQNSGNNSTKLATTAYVDAQVATGAADATTSTRGIVQLTGDLGGTATSPTVPGLALKANTADVTTSLALKEDISNKSNAALGTSITLYPTQSAVKTYVDAQVASATIADADASTKGKLQLTGDLGGTASSPTVPGLTAKANIASPTFTGTVTSPIYASAPQALTDAETISWNPANGLNANVTLGGNRTLSFSTAPASGSYGTLVVTQDGTGSRTLTLPSGTNKVLGSASTTTIALSTAAGAKDILNFYYDGLTSTYYWNVGQGYGIAETIESTNLASAVTGTLPVANGGTGAITATAALTALGAQASANLSTNITTDAASTTKYPAVKTIKDYVDAQVSSATIADADATTKGKLQLTGDLGGSATSPSVIKLRGTPISSVAPTTAGHVLTYDVNGSATWAAPANSANTISGVVPVANGGTGLSSVTNGGAVYASSSSALTTGTLPLTAGGTGVTTQQAAINALTGTQSAGKYLRSNGTDATLSTIQAADVPTLNQNTTGTAANVTGTVAVANGGTGATTPSAALTALGAAPIASPTFTGTLTAPIYASAPQALTDAETISWNPANGLNANVTLGGNRTLSFSTAPASGSYGTLVVTQDGTGSRTLTLPSGTNKVLGSASTTTIALSTAAGAKDILNFYYDGLTSTYYWNVGQGYGTAATAATVNLATGVTGTLAVTNGGTGASALAANNVLLGNGANALQVVAPGASGNVLTSNGTTWSSSAPQNSANTISGVVSIANGGTGAISQQTAINALTGTQSAGKYLRSNGTDATLSTIQAADVPTLNQNTTGTAANVTGTVGVANGGTGATTLTGIIKGTGTSALTAAIAGTDYQAPLTLTTTGTGAATLSGTTLNIPAVSSTVNSNTLSGTVSVANGGTGATSKTTAFDALSPMTTAGDIIFGGTSGTGTRLGKGNNGTVLTMENNIPTWLTSIRATAGSTYNAAVGFSFLGGDWARNTGMFSDNPDGGGAATLKFRIATSNSTADPYLEISPSKVSVSPTTASTSKTTGALTVAGGLGVTGDVFATNLNASGTVTAGAVTYPNAHNSTAGQVLTVNAAGSASWATPTSSGVPYTGATQAVNLGPYDLTVNGLTVGKGKKDAGTDFQYNSAFGVSALGNFNVGTKNTAFGYNALSSVTNSNQNIAIGVLAMGSTNADFQQSVAVGNSALQHNRGSFNTALGSNAISSTNLTSNATYLVGVGALALHNNSTGQYNTAVGSYALSTNTTGNNNTALGQGADVFSATLDNATAIGYNAKVSASNSIQLGNTNVTNVKTSGTITAGDITYPKTHGSANQVLTTSGSGTLTWATPSTTATAYSGTLPIANGGTNSTATATSGGIGYGTGTAHAYTSAGTSGQVLTSAGAGAPTWSTLAAVRMNSDEFTATAAQTEFAFTTASSTTGAVQTPLSKPFMYINGIRIKNAAFTWTSGTTTVTYVPANNNSYTLVAGDRIQFDYAY